jgi:hypothetical protein
VAGVVISCRDTPAGCPTSRREQPKFSRSAGDLHVTVLIQRDVETLAPHRNVLHSRREPSVGKRWEQLHFAMWNVWVELEQATEDQP